MDYREHYLVRNKIIECLHDKQIDKREFIMRNLEAYEGVSFLRLPNKFESMEHALYHYQFHNVKAKYFKWQYMEQIDKNMIHALECKAKSDSHYESKEAVTLELLKQFFPLFLGDESNAALNMSANTCANIRVNIDVNAQADIGARDYAKADKKVSAYYLAMNSKNLNKRLVEIVFHDFDKVILHTLDAKVISILRSYGVLEKEARNSLIDSYVNEKFY